MVKTTVRTGDDLRTKKAPVRKADDLTRPRAKSTTKPVSRPGSVPAKKKPAPKAKSSNRNMNMNKKKPVPKDSDSLFGAKLNLGSVMGGSEQAKRKQEKLDTEKIFGTELSFAAREAYKLLRTNLIFSLPSAENGYGHIVGMTSALRGEGKSTTTINLAGVLAEQDKKVIVVEGDLRLPSLHKKLKMQVKDGLSHVLISRANPLDYVQPCSAGTMENKKITFDILMAGTIPPNPSELLGSKRMEEVLGILARHYDFVLLDLPPVTAVSDALVATKLVDGVVLVVRNEHCSMGSLNEAIRQIQLVEGKILGFVFTCANSNRGVYRKKYNYRYYSYSE